MRTYLFAINSLTDVLVFMKRLNERVQILVVDALFT